MDNLIQASFEQDFIERTYQNIVGDMLTAFAEIIANAWDAGATQVKISIPVEAGGKIIIEDNGSGMTDEEFQSRWMKMGYNRVAHQGEYVEYPSENGKIRRRAYGRNGVGRHALFCFHDAYVVETWKDGKCNQYNISSSSTDGAVFVVTEQESYEKQGHGTKLTVNAVKKLPDIAELKNALSYRFLFDPAFEIYVNNAKIDHYNYVNAIKEDTLTIDGQSVLISIYDIPDGVKNLANNGIAFWVEKKLVGNPSWKIDSTQVEDARRKFALKHIVTIKVDFLLDDVKGDWSGFRNTELVLKTQKAVVKYLREFRVEYYRGKVDEVKATVIRENIEEIENLSIPSRYELKEFFEYYLEAKPETESEELNIIIGALISVLQSRNGLSLLGKLASLNPSEVDTLDNILSEWSIFDVKTVLDEIDARLKIITAIEQLCGDKTVDELHTLHPIVTQARWLFGIEFDNLNYTSNRSLSTVIKEFFDGKKKANTNINWSKRPDLVLGADFTMGATCTEGFDDNDISYVENILIIELKKGGFEIKDEEMFQANQYVNYIYNGNKLNARPKIKAFVVGDCISPAIGPESTIKDANGREYGVVKAYTYTQLVMSAKKRLFALKDKLAEKYNDLDVDNFLQKIIDEPRQMEMNISSKKA